MLTELHIHLHNAGLYLASDGDYNIYLKNNSDTFKESYLSVRWEDIKASYSLLKGLKECTLTDMIGFVNEGFDSLEK